MKNYVMYLGVYVWDIMKNGYKKPYLLIDKDDKIEFTYNAKVMNKILGGLPESKLVKVLHCIISKEIWDKLRSCYDDDNKVKKAKLQVYIMKFGSLKMNEDEDISKFFLCVDEIVNITRWID